MKPKITRLADDEHPFDPAYQMNNLNTETWVFYPSEVYPSELEDDSLDDWRIPTVFWHMLQRGQISAMELVLLIYLIRVSGKTRPTDKEIARVLNIPVMKVGPLLLGLRDKELIGESYEWVEREGTKPKDDVKAPMIEVGW